MGIHQMITPAIHGQPAPVSNPRLPGSEANALEAALADMIAAFSGDFVNGRAGEHHNTYEHRSRVLRQMAGSLAAMRARDAGAAS
jgi:hypothetical protein